MWLGIKIAKKEKEYIDILEASQKPRKRRKTNTSKSKVTKTRGEAPLQGGSEAERRHTRRDSKFKTEAKRLRRAQVRKSETLKERREGHMKDALALGGEEGRDKLR